MRCVSCHQKKAKRSCPALGGMICPQCCGNKRNTEIKCTGDCAYLPKAENYHAQKKELKELKDRARQIKPPEETEFSEERRMIMLRCTAVIFDFYEETPKLVDKDVQEALELLVKNCRTRGAGLIYAQRADRPMVNALISEIEEVIDHLVNKEKTKMDDIIYTLERLVDMVIISRSRGESDRYYLYLLRGMFQNMPYPYEYEDEEDSPIVDPRIIGRKQRGR
ncbi:MAG: hypothetical protein AB1797_00210 [bacterium]